MIRALIPPPDVDLALLFRDDILFQQASAALGPLIDPGIESVAAFRGDATYAGIEGFRKMWLDWLEPWATYHSRIDDLIDAGDRVAVLIRDRARPHDTHFEVELIFGLGVGGPTGQDRPGPVLPRPQIKPSKPPGCRESSTTGSKSSGSSTAVATTCSLSGARWAPVR